MGRLSDRLGHKWMNGLAMRPGRRGGGASCSRPARPPGSSPAFVLLNLSQSGLRISQMSLAMEIGGAERAPTFSAVMSTLLAFPTLLAPLAGGWAVDSIGFKPAFCAGLALYAAGLAVLALGVTDPRVAAARGRRA